MQYQVAEYYHQNTSKYNDGKPYNISHEMSFPEAVGTLKNWALMSDNITIDDDGSLWNGKSLRWSAGDMSIDMGDSTITIEEFKE